MKKGRGGEDGNEKGEGLLLEPGKSKKKRWSTGLSDKGKKNHVKETSKGSQKKKLS